MDYREDSEGRCNLAGDCSLCVLLNCSWTGSFFRPCKASVEDMEEVPTRVVQHEVDCPHQSLNDRRPGEKSDDLWLALEITLWCAVVAVLIVFLIRFLLRKAFKERDAASSTELQILGLSTKTVNEV